ncbi:glycoside hydrolase family 16 protein [Calocera viscosa TUFC12733]|uniref:Glycoside hydrolase family 16 protein n=1 Tax=Calocera viscosa (strain TUFC12733) TaxID=1330018 RepID=A0A167JK42_CALVF|nr:glycoside hydrolase family 16 protein [Calocera viscosa TUFC12733]
MYLWDAKDPDLDDALHNPDPVTDARLDRRWTIASLRGWLNMSTLLILICALLMLFIGYPALYFFGSRPTLHSGFNLGGINSTGQVPDIPGTWQMIDPSTPQNAMTRVGFDGQNYDLVFSDEFEVDGRTFYPGDDPYWEAVNLHYWATVDYEWYDPSAITTQDGKLVITMTEELIHNLNWKSGMLQSWNKFCFTTGYIEVSVSLPGAGAVPGFWPGVWMMGNLGRAGYGASTEGVWPYTYDTCDLGTFPNQTNADGTPLTDKTDGDQYNNYQLSYMPGQKLSACSCPGSDHPGPNVAVGRGAPEIDILEGQVNVWENQGTVSQSFQVAPFNDWYEFDNTTTTLYGQNGNTVYNGYKGGVYQQSVSAVTLVSNENYNNTAYGVFGVEYWSNPSNRGEGYVTWVADGQRTWNMPAAAIGADPISEISERIVSEEPMSMVLNFGMSSGFQGQDFTRLQFPATFYIDYVRVYQRTSVSGNPSYQSCDPASYPTATYINEHLNAYQNPNLTTWDSAGYTFPRNSKYDGC